MYFEDKLLTIFFEIIVLKWKQGKCVISIYQHMHSVDLFSFNQGKSLWFEWGEFTLNQSGELQNEFLLQEKLCVSLTLGYNMQRVCKVTDIFVELAQIHPMDQVVYLKDFVIWYLRSQMLRWLTLMHHCIIKRSKRNLAMPFSRSDSLCRSVNTQEAM